MPVLFGTVTALGRGSVPLLLLFSVFCTALSFQILANLSNDYFDFIQGADTEKRKGFRRMLSSGLISKGEMQKGLVICALACVLFSIYPTIVSGPFVIFITLGLLLAAVFYTSGKKSIAYQGFAEITVFLLFGILGTCLTHFFLRGSVTLEVAVVSMIPGFLSTALILLNNIRDVEEDRLAEKKTIVVRFGTKVATTLFFICIFGAALTPCLIVAITRTHYFSLFAAAALIPTFATMGLLLNLQERSDLNDHFVRLAKMQMAYSIIFALTYLL